MFQSTPPAWGRRHRVANYSVCAPEPEDCTTRGSSTPALPAYALECAASIRRQPSPRPSRRRGEDTSLGSSHAASSEVWQEAELNLSTVESAITTSPNAPQHPYEKRPLEDTHQPGSSCGSKVPESQLVIRHFGANGSSLPQVLPFYDANLRRSKLPSAVAVAVEDSALRNRGLQHLFQTKRLRAELQGIENVGSAHGTLVVHWVRRRVILYCIGPSGQVQPLRPQLHAAHSTDTGTTAFSGQIARSCNSRPSAVRTFSPHTCSRWISAH
jgi:hypothetical protein